LFQFNCRRITCNFDAEVYYYWKNQRDYCKQRVKRWFIRLPAGFKTAPIVTPWHSAGKNGTTGVTQLNVADFCRGRDGAAQISLATGLFGAFLQKTRRFMRTWVRGNPRTIAPKA
jgi:hypothetical protein